MIKFLFPDYEFHFFGKPYCTYFLDYGRTNENFGEEQYKKLVSGEKTFAIHLPDKENKASYFVYDVDGPNDGGVAALSVYEGLDSHLNKLGFSPTVFFSGSKGYHLYVFFDRKYSISILRDLATELLKDFVVADGINIEVFPKNKEVNYSKKQYGNHLKAPLSVHPKTGVVSTQLTDYIVNTKRLDADAQSNKINKDLHEEKYQLKLPSVIYKKVDCELLAVEISPYFSATNRHKIALGISGHFKKSGIDKDTTIYFFDRLIDLAGGDTSDIHRVIDDTFSERKYIASLDTAELSLDAENHVYSFTSGVSLNTIKLDIVKIRESKRPPHIKVDLASNAVIEFIKSRFRTFHDDNFIYLIDGNKIYTNVDRTFESLLIIFGINTEESFARQVRKVVLDYLYTFSVFMQPINFCEYKDNKISLYTKDSIVVVDKTTTITIEDFYPVTNKKDFIYVEPAKRNTSLKEYLKIFNLKPKDSDLILAWLVTQMFNEGINTKPVLLIQGQPQAGKSTLANFLMRMIEDKKSEVIAYTGKDDALIASLQKHKVLVLDNLEYISGKILDLINSVVTGAVIELRALYTTNNVVKIKPRSSLVITSAHGSFDNDGAFQSRLIKVRLFDRVGFAVESKFWDDFEGQYNDLVSDLIDLCSEVLKRRDKLDGKNYRIRMTDFIDICSILKDSGFISTDIEQMLLEDQERDKYMTPYLEIFKKIRFKEEIYNPFTINEIYPRFRAVAATYGLDKITSTNLGQKLLKTGIFTVTSAGFYRLLQPIYNREVRLD